MSFHWTSEANAERIEVEGIRQNSFFCRRPEDWRGEVCFEVLPSAEIDWDWENEGKDWQRCNFDEVIAPIHLRRM